MVQNCLLKVKYLYLGLLIFNYIICRCIPRHFSLMKLQDTYSVVALFYCVTLFCFHYFLIVRPPSRAYIANSLLVYIAWRLQIGHSNFDRNINSWIVLLLIDFQCQALHSLASLLYVELTSLLVAFTIRSLCGLTHYSSLRAKG